MQAEKSVTVCQKVLELHHAGVEPSKIDKELGLGDGVSRSIVVEAWHDDMVVNTRSRVFGDIGRIASGRRRQR